MGWVVNTTPRPLYPREQPGAHCIGGWVGPRAGLDGCGKSRPHRDSILGLTVCSEYTHQLRYPGPRTYGQIYICIYRQVHLKSKTRHTGTSSAAVQKCHSLGYRSVVFFRQLRLNALSFPRGQNRLAFKKMSFFSCLF